MSVLIEKAGMLTSIQDKGRFGLGQFGVTSSGAVDSRSLDIANMLVGNERNAAALEATILGPRVRFLSDTVFSVTGADMSPILLNNREVKMYQSIYAHRGDILSLGVARQGCRSYIAFAGGIMVPEVMGSKSTYMRGKFGGIEGRALREGDVVGIGCPKKSLDTLYGKYVDPDEFSEKNIVVRVVRGPQEDDFTEKGYKTFFQNTYQVTMECDRMGIRLDGEIIEHSKNGNIISDGIVNGSVQVPPNGKPIIMLAERQTTGGYPKIATVISSDIPLVAQLRPDMSIRFQEITVEEAQEFYIRSRNLLENIARDLAFQPVGKAMTCRPTAQRIANLFL